MLPASMKRRLLIIWQTVLICQGIDHHLDDQGHLHHDQYGTQELQHRHQARKPDDGVVEEHDDKVQSHHQSQGQGNGLMGAGILLRQQDKHHDRRHARGSDDDRRRQGRQGQLKGGAAALAGGPALGLHKDEV